MPESYHEVRSSQNFETEQSTHNPNNQRLDRTLRANNEPPRIARRLMLDGIKTALAPGFEVPMRLFCPPTDDGVTRIKFFPRCQRSKSLYHGTKPGLTFNAESRQDQEKKSILQSFYFLLSHNYLLAASAPQAIQSRGFFLISGLSILSQQPPRRFGGHSNYHSPTSNKTTKNLVESK